MTLCSGDLLDQLSIIQLLDQHMRDEFYNLAAMEMRVDADMERLSSRAAVTA